MYIDSWKINMLYYAMYKCTLLKKSPPWQKLKKIAEFYPCGTYGCDARRFESAWNAKIRSKFCAAQHGLYTLHLLPMPTRNKRS